MKIKSERTYFISAEEIQQIIAEYIVERENVMVTAADVVFEITPRDSRPYDDFHTTVAEHLKQAVVKVSGDPPPRSNTPPSHAYPYG